MVMDFIDHVLLALWLPIVLSAVFCFIAAAVIWMLGPHHRHEWKSLPAGEQIQGLLRSAGVQPGGYLMPYAFDQKRAKDPAYMEPLMAGPLATVYMRAGGWNMGRTMSLQFIFMLVVSVFVAHQARNASEWGDSFVWVFHDAAITAFIAYFMAAIPDSLWWGRPWNSLLRQLVDALVYAAITGATFGWLWPATG